MKSIIMHLNNIRLWKRTKTSKNCNNIYICQEEGIISVHTNEELQGFASANWVNINQVTGKND